jgi:hypothetical protein
MTESWREQVVRHYNERHAEAGRAKTVFGRALRPLQLSATLAYVAFIDKAAAQRGVDRSTYARRALAVLASSDLGVPVKVILWESPKPRHRGAVRARFQEGGARDEGDGIRDWCPHHGCDGAHLSD